MAIHKVVIENFKIFKHKTILDLSSGMNIIVGNNEVGKSTLLEAMHLALTGYYSGRSISQELSQYLFNSETIREYLESIRLGTPTEPPRISIEIFFDGSIDPLFEGDNNSDGASAEGFIFSIAYSEKYDLEYQSIIKSKKLNSLPIEYYEATWMSFGRKSITPRSIPIKSAMIDSVGYKAGNGSDAYISRIVRNLLSEDEIVSVAQAHRNMREQFQQEQAIVDINTRIQSETDDVKGKVSLSVDIGTKNAWETSLVTELNDIPLAYAGKGQQCIIKTELALSNKTAQRAEIILIEEPESHLSFSKLNQLLAFIESKYSEKQIVVSTHSSFVANKLGLDKIILLDNNSIIRMDEFTSATFFSKVAGYDTLRLLLCKKAILVEGASDELVVQRAYMDAHEGKLPIQDGIDVISVGLAFLRFLEIAKKLNKSVCVVTDNDGDINAIQEKYKDYLGDNAVENIKIFYDDEIDGPDQINGATYNANTLEPKILKANDLSTINRVLGKNYDNEDDLRIYMKNNKTDCALRIFETIERINYPEYIRKAIESE